MEGRPRRRSSALGDPFLHLSLASFLLLLLQSSLTFVCSHASGLLNVALCIEYLRLWQICLVVAKSVLLILAHMQESISVKLNLQELRLV